MRVSGCVCACVFEVYILYTSERIANSLAQFFFFMQGLFFNKQQLNIQTASTFETGWEITRAQLGKSLLFSNLMPTSEQLRNLVAFSYCHYDIDMSWWKICDNGCMTILENKSSCSLDLKEYWFWVVYFLFCLFRLLKNETVITNVYRETEEQSLKYLLLSFHGYSFFSLFCTSC